MSTIADHGDLVSSHLHQPMRPGEFPRATNLRSRNSVSVFEFRSNGIDKIAQCLGNSSSCMALPVGASPVRHWDWQAHTWHAHRPGEVALGLPGGAPSGPAIANTPRRCRNQPYEEVEDTDHHYPPCRSIPCNPGSGILDCKDRHR